MRRSHVREPNACFARCVAVLFALASPALVRAADAVQAPPAGAPEVPTLERVTVVATRQPRPVARVPAAVSVVAGRELRTDTAGTDLSEKLVGVPGILARDRQNVAQDEQLSIRGFGARATFGVRGVRVIVDGVPATMPDGQGQLSHIDLASAGRIEVLRGPFSALYGNSSGGVVVVESARGEAPGSASIAATRGSFDALRASVGARGVAGAVAYDLDATRLRTDGFRDHSAAERTTANAKIDIAAGEGVRLGIVANRVDIPRALDPLGLTRAQFEDDPRQATAAASQFDTRKAVRQAQAGLVLEVDASATQAFRAIAYRGHRDVEQFLAIPVAAQANPLHGGGVVVLSSPYGGADLRWTSHATVAARPLDVVAGLSFDAQQQHRRGYENFIGTTLGVRGALRRDEDDRVSAFDEYAQATWNPDGAWSLFAGMRHDAVRFTVRDRYVTAANPDDSGMLAFAATTPVGGVAWRVRDGVHAYASFGAGFETPTFDELGYRPDGGSGPNLALRPARSRNGELGLKLDAGRALHLDAALFRADTRDEIAVATSSGGRTTFQNVGHARRAGVELAADAAWGDRWRARLAATWLDARFRDGFLACSGTPCSVPDIPVPAGARIPGVPRVYGSARLDWGAGTGPRASIDARYVGAVGVNNTGTDRAGAYAVFGAALGYAFDRGRCAADAFVRVDNLFDRRYAGSVIVNDGNGRYFEPAPGRTLLAGLTLRWRE